MRRYVMDEDADQKQDVLVHVYYGECLLRSLLRQDFCGVRDFLTLGLAAQVRKSHAQRGKPVGVSAEPQRLNCRRFAAKHKGFLASREPGRPNRFPTHFRERKKEQS